MTSPQFVYANLHRIYGTVPAPGQTWQFCDVRDHGMDKSLLQALRDMGAIDQESRDRWGATWSTTEIFGEMVEKAADRQGYDADGALLLLVEIETQ